MRRRDRIKYADVTYYCLYDKKTRKRMYIQQAFRTYILYWS